jgi:hypothetical protein
MQMFYMLSVKNGLKQDNALLPLLVNVAGTMPLGGPGKQGGVEIK